MKKTVRETSVKAPKLTRNWHSE